jgi:hypothetical protein
MASKPPSPSQSFSAAAKAWQRNAFIMSIVALTMLALVLWEHHQFDKRIEGRAYFIDSYNAGVGRTTDYTNVADREIEVLGHARLWSNLMFEFDQNNFEANLSKAKDMSGNPSIDIINSYKTQNLFEEMIATNTRNRIEIDSIGVVKPLKEPYGVSLFARRIFESPTVRSSYYLYATMELINVSRTEQNPHGLLVSKFTVLNQDRIE